MKLQPIFNPNAKNVVKSASGGGECRYMRHASLKTYIYPQK